MYPLFLISNMDFKYIDFHYLIQFKKFIINTLVNLTILFINLNQFQEVLLLLLLLPTESLHQYQYHYYILPKQFMSVF